MRAYRMQRRQFLATLSTGALAMLVAACSSNDQSIVLPTKTTAPAGAASSAPSAAPAAGGSAAPAAGGSAAPAAAPANVPEVPRNQTLVLSVSDSINQMTDTDIMNPFLNGVQRTGWHFSYEPLYYYDSVWNDKTSAPAGLTGQKGEIPYQAESYAYNADYTELTVKIKQGVTWSDGKPLTTDDLIFTVNMLKDNAPKLIFSGNVKLWVKDVVAVDAQTAKFTLNQPNPQFMFQFFQWYQDVGFPIVPKHIFTGQDPLTFTHKDIAKGWPITTGPWKLAFADPTQKIWDRRDDWWGAKTGFRKLPAMKRVIILPHFEDAKLTQLLSAGEVDSTHNIFAADTEVALARNPKLSTFVVSKKPPYGAIDGWTNAIKINCMQPPYNDKDIRWALNYAINRKQIIDVGFKGSGEYTVLPLPAYPGMKVYFDSVKDLLEKNPIDVYDPNKTAQIMQSKGYAKNGDGFWAKDGKVFSFTLVNSPGFFLNFAPVVVAQFRQAGFDASFKNPTDAGTLQAAGNVEIWIDGHQGGVRDPYLTLNQFHSRYALPIGEAVPAPNGLNRWKNPAYDAIIDEMTKIAPASSKFMDLYHQAMAIWIPELPSIPTVQWYQICPVNTAYWKGWPNEENPYTTPASWHRTAGLFIGSLEPA